MKKLFAILLAAALCLSGALAETAPSADGAAAFGEAPFGIFPAVAGKDGTDYVSLFDTIVSDEWNPLWVDYIGAVVGEDAAPLMAAALQGSVTSDLHGEDAVAAFADGGYAFDCHFINGAQTADFEAYAIDNGEKGDGAGIYVAYSNMEYEAEAAPYTLAVNDAGQTVLTLVADDGVISWVKQ